MIVVERLVDVYDEDIAVVDGDAEDALDAQLGVEVEPVPAEQRHCVREQLTHARLVRSHCSAPGQGVNSGAGRKERRR